MHWGLLPLPPPFPSPFPPPFLPGHPATWASTVLLLGLSYSSAGCAFCLMSWHCWWGTDLEPISLLAGSLTPLRIRQTMDIISRKMYTPLTLSFLFHVVLGVWEIRNKFVIFVFCQGSFWQSDETMDPFSGWWFFWVHRIFFFKVDFKEKSVKMKQLSKF